MRATITSFAEYVAAGTILRWENFESSGDTHGSLWLHNEGLDWARGWNTMAANAFRTVVALEEST